MFDIYTKPAIYTINLIKLLLNRKQQLSNIGWIGTSIMTCKVSSDFIYLDNQRTTPVDQRVIECMLPYFDKVFGNAHSDDHYFGWCAKKAVDTARATEANNLAILGILPAIKATGKNKIIVSAFEHKCILECAKAAENYGMELIVIYPDKDGIVNPDELLSLIDGSVGLVSIIAVNNEIGTIQPIGELCSIAHDAGAFFHTDATQAAIFMDLDVAVSNVDLLGLSAHKIYGPKGIGGLFIKRELQGKIVPLIHGGGQEAGLRSGTLSTMLCVGFGKACKLIKDEREKNTNHLKHMS